MIQINDNYGVTTDDLNWILNRKTYKRKKEGNKWVDTDEVTWAVAGYYANLEQLIEAITRKELMSTKFKDLDTVLKKIKELDKMIKKLNLKDIKLEDLK